MSTFKLTITTNGAAFTGTVRGPAEVAYLLRKIAALVETGRTEGNIIDSNGHTAGKYNWTKP